MLSQSSTKGEHLLLASGVIVPIVADDRVEAELCLGRSIVLSVPRQQVGPLEGGNQFCIRASTFRIPVIDLG